MEYKGMTIKQSRNKNVIIYRNDELYLITNKEPLSDEQLKEVADKIKFDDEEVENGKSE